MSKQHIKFIMRKVFLSFSVIAVVLGFAACKKKETAPATTANVMFVNGCAGASNIDVSVSGTKLAAASNLAFLKNSGYKAVTSGAVPIAFSLTATGTPLINGSGSLTTGSNYSVFAGGLVSGTSTCFVFANDDLAAPASGMAKVRFVNLASDSLRVNCFIGTKKIDSNVSITAITPFYSITAATGATVLLQDPSAPTKLAQITGQNFAAGKIYTLMLTGASSGTGVSALTLTLINNN